MEFSSGHGAREHEQIEPQKTEEDSLEDHHGLGSCGLEDFDWPLAPNAGRMWPTCAPQRSTTPSLPASVSPTPPSSISASSDSALFNMRAAWWKGTMVGESW